MTTYGDDFEGDYFDPELDEGRELFRKMAKGQKYEIDQAWQQYSQNLLNKKTAKYKTKYDIDDFSFQQMLNENPNLHEKATNAAVKTYYKILRNVKRGREQPQPVKGQPQVKTRFQGREAKAI